MDLQVRALVDETHIQPNDGGASCVLGLCDTVNGPVRAGAVKQSALDATTVPCVDTAIKGSMHGMNPGKRDAIPFSGRPVTNSNVPG